MPDQGVDDGGPKPVLIGQITLAFHNQQVINWLKRRGLAIKNEDWDKVKSINDEIAKGLKDDQVLNTC